MRLFLKNKMVLSLWLVIGVMGCAGPQPAVTPQQLAAEPARKDVFAAGDVVEIKFTYTPQFNESQTISPGGTISLPLIGQIKAEGKTREELRQELMKTYSELLEQPEIMVLARTQIKRRIYVGGQVNRPGFVEMPGDMSVLEAIISAGWVDVKTASPNILIIRQKNGESYGAVLNVADALGGKRTKAFYLHPQDIVYVPRSGISKVNQWIDQYINKMVPQFGFTYFYPIGPGGAGRLGIDTTGARPRPY
ncbi:MAG: polysaccharide biosynthesis/export family protein [Deltaproteobacteria bacterium]|nr:polysaccharide biosynthesis/export family protein [Deltaproteobacteria bacterium]MBW1952472.1 polysaccharide biosynthesis/export family protein [Deltaproteobacteria bacterium]MBW1987401.1 polysaccharide biosynthesis/export family protein [Deltaproteobacteria bacterium]MBW2135184.1 polysaccharide biosynthesis/export family protein [Deltaproteobacteria bacterium]